MIAIVDYDAGNLKSVEKALLSIGEEVTVTRDPECIKNADGIVLPGVGSFGDAMGKLERYSLVECIRDTIDSGKPFLGICLGMQLLFNESEESPGVRGLSVFPGKIVRIPDAEGIKIPHMGWNSLDITVGAKLLKNIGDHPYVYFVHSYYAETDDSTIVAASTEYGVRLTVSVERGNTFGCQFHPEKSGNVGMQILKNFGQLTREMR